MVWLNRSLIIRTTCFRTFRYVGKRIMEKLIQKLHVMEKCLATKESKSNLTDFISNYFEEHMNLPEIIE